MHSNSVKSLDDLIARTKEYFSQKEVQTVWAFEDFATQLCPPETARVALYVLFPSESRPTWNTLYDIEEELHSMLGRDVFVTTKTAIDHAPDCNWVKLESKTVYSTS
jgi:predicted nucleotidyltransferase